MKALANIRRRQKRMAGALAYLYKFPWSDYLSLLASQGQRCAICGRHDGNDKGHRLNIDHDHETGRVRGLLCMNCNRGLGLFDHDPLLLEKAIDYLG